MRLERIMHLPTTSEKAWNLISDIPTLAACIPGVELVGEDENGDYLGAITFRTGPKAVRFDGRVTFIFNSDHHSGELEAVGADRRQASRAKAHLDFELHEGPEWLDLRLSGDVTFVGALSEFAESGGVYVGAQLMDAFAAELQQRLIPYSADTDVLDRASLSVSSADAVKEPIRIRLFSLIRYTLKTFWNRRREVKPTATTERETADEGA